MKFFSNEPKENADAPDYDRTNVVTSEPVAVPQQRAGSPWTNAPGSPDDELADRERRDGTTDDTSDISDTSEKDADLRDDHPDPETTKPYGEDGLTATTDHRADTDDTTTTDETLKDDGTFDSPRAVEPATGEQLSDRDVEPAADATDTRTDATDTDRETDDRETDTDRELDTEPVAETEPVPVTADRSETTADTDATPAHATSPADAEPVNAAPVDTPVDATAVAVAVPATAGIGSATTGTGTGSAAPDRLFTDSDAFAGRFRDIQLRFVDSPKDATAEAAALVAEAVDQLTSTLNEQKSRLASNSDDTEKLRVELRSYRDLLNRLLAL